MMRIVLLLPLLLLSACGSSREPDYYTLAPVAAKTPAPHSPPLTVKVMRPGLPAALDRPDIVQMSGEYGVTRNSAEQWAEPLDAMMARVLAADLSTRLPAGSSVITEGGGIDATAPYRLEIEIQTFGEQGGQVWLAGQLAVNHSPQTPVVPVPITLQVTSAGGTEGFVASASQALAELADRAAMELNAARSIDR